MIYPSADKLEIWGSKFALVTLAAKRAKQLKGGSPPRIETESRNPLTIALEEIAEGKVITTVADTDALPVAAVEPEIAQLLAIPTEVEVKESDEEELEAAAVTDIDEDILVTDEDEEWEEEAVDEEDELPLDAVLDVKADDHVEELVIDEAVEKPKRGRRKAVAKEEEEKIPDIDSDISIDDVETDVEDEQEYEE